MAGLEKNKEDSLFQLIRSLSKAEKRYFKVNSTHTIGEKNNYMKLFDALDGLAEYDDAKFRQKFKKEPFIKYLAAEKNYLYEQILKSLRGYRTDKSKYLKLIGLLQDIDLLNEKKLFEECDKRIKKAQKIAIDLNYFDINAILIDWKFILLNLLEDESLKEVLNAYNIEAMENYNRLINFYRYRAIKNEASIISKKNIRILTSEDQKRVTELLNSPYIKNPEQANSVIAQHEYFSAYALLLRIHKDIETEYQVRKRQIKLFEEWPEMIEEFRTKYNYSLAQFMAVSVRVNDFEGYQASIEKFGMGNNPDDFKEMKIINMGANQMYYLMNNSKWDEAVKLSNILEEMMVKYGSSISWTQLITIKYNTGCVNFILSQFGEAVDRFDYIINEKQETYIGQLLASRILHLICHYEISPPTVVEYLLGSAIRFATKIEDKNEFNSIILKGIKKLTRTIDKAETRQIMTQMRDDLLDVFEQYQFGLGLEEAICWLISRIENRTVLEVVNERLEIERKMAQEKLKTSNN